MMFLCRCYEQKSGKFPQMCGNHTHSLTHSYIGQCYTHTQFFAVSIQTTGVISLKIWNQTVWNDHDGHQGKIRNHMYVQI